tara:strand:+ start:10699 stop:11046 length:348 start_codon:yes stop_codon:yes gene_type:complete
MQKLDFDMDYFVGGIAPIKGTTRKKLGEQEDLVDLPSTEVTAKNGKITTITPILPSPKMEIAPAKIDAPSITDVLNTSSSNKDTKRKKTMLYVGIGLGILALGTIAIILIKRKKK